MKSLTGAAIGGGVALLAALSIAGLWETMSHMVIACGKALAPSKVTAAGLTFGPRQFLMAGVPLATWAGAGIGAAIALLHRVWTASRAESNKRRHGRVANNKVHQKPPRSASARVQTLEQRIRTKK